MIMSNELPNGFLDNHGYEIDRTSIEYNDPLRLIAEAIIDALNIVI